MKRLIAMLAALLLSASSACAAWMETEVLHYALPVDFSPGMPVNPLNYVSETVYQDPTLKVVISSDFYSGVRYWIADIEIADASQLRTVAAESFDSKGAEAGSVLARRVNAVIAVDGDIRFLRLFDDLLCDESAPGGYDSGGLVARIVFQRDGLFGFLWFLRIRHDDSSLLCRSIFGSCSGLFSYVRTSKEISPPRICAWETRRKFTPL